MILAGSASRLNICADRQSSALSARRGYTRCSDSSAIVRHCKGTQRQSESEQCYFVLKKLFIKVAYFSTPGFLVSPPQTCDIG